MTGLGKKEYNDRKNKFIRKEIDLCRKKPLNWLSSLLFFRIGLFTFGGGFAMIPLIRREFVDKQGWIDERDL